jgi:hypothetical protein
MRLNQVKTFVRTMSQPERPPTRGVAFVCPAAILALTSSAVRPVCWVFRALSDCRLLGFPLPHRGYQTSEAFLQ